MILVLGATGLVGQALLTQLRDRKLPHIGVSRQGGSLHNQGYLKWPLSEVRYGSILQGVTCLVHLANSVTPGGMSDQVKLQGFAENAVTNAHVVQLCAQHQIPKLIWVGSSTGYGDGNSGSEEHFGEGHVLDAVVGPAMAARSFELQLQAIARLSPMDVRVLRPTTVIGPSDPIKKPPLHAATQLIWSMLCGEESTIYVPEVSRDYLFSRDLARLLVEETLIPPQPHTFEAYNVGSGQYKTLSEVAAVVSSVLRGECGSVTRVISNSPPAVHKLPLLKGQGRFSAPRVRFEDGIADILSSYVKVVSKS